MVHPNTQRVNMAQSINDTFPSATHSVIAPRLDKIVCEAGSPTPPRCQSKAFRNTSSQVGRKNFAAYRVASDPGQEFRGLFLRFGVRHQSTKAPLRPAAELDQRRQRRRHRSRSPTGYMDAFYKYQPNFWANLSGPIPNPFLDWSRIQTLFSPFPGAVKPLPPLPKICRLRAYELGSRQAG